MVVSGRVRTYLASEEDLTLNVMGASSGLGVSSAMVKDVKDSGGEQRGEKVPVTKYG